MMSKAEFGSRISFTHSYKRRWSSEGRHHSGRKHWQRTDNVGDGIFLGQRTLADGRSYYEEDYGYIFEPDSHFRAALVCPGPNLNPIYVPLDAITPATEEPKQ